MGKKAKWKQVSDEELRKLVQESQSYRDLAKRLGYNPDAGQTNEIIKNIIKEKNLDISHFKHNGWNRNNYDYSRFTNDNKTIRSASMLDALVFLKGYKCDICGLQKWLGKPITLEVHHVDGDHYNNDINNLQVLCPNCHSQTDSFRGRNINKKRETVSDEELVEALEECDSIRQALIKVGLTGAGANYYRANELIVKYQIEKYLRAPEQETL